MYEVCPVLARVSLTYFNVSPAVEWLHLQKNLADPGAYVLIFDSPYLPSLCRQRLAHLPDQLLVRLIQAYDGPFGSVRSGVDV